MFRCIYSVISRIFCSVSEVPAVNCETSCWISGVGSRRDFVSALYHNPMSVQVPVDFSRSFGSLGKYFRPTHPATVLHGGICGSILMPGRLFTSQMYSSGSGDCGFTSG